MPSRILHFKSKVKYFLSATWKCSLFNHVYSSINIITFENLRYKTYNNAFQTVCQANIKTTNNTSLSFSHIYHSITFLLWLYYNYDILHVALGNKNNWLYLGAGSPPLIVLLLGAPRFYKVE